MVCCENGCVFSIYGFAARCPSQEMNAFLMFWELDCVDSVAQLETGRKYEKYENYRFSLAPTIII